MTNIELQLENQRRLAKLAELNAPPASLPELPSDEALRNDFALWAEKCVRIRHKLSGEMVPLRLNRPQRRVLAELERQRLQGRPIRLILLKSRQWGGSTLILLYMAWIQLLHRENWHSLICAHLKEAATTIRAIYSNLIDLYPEPRPDGLKIVPFEGMKNVRLIKPRGCKISVCSAENVDAARGADYAMAHLSEVAFWADTPAKRAADLVRAICGSVPRTPCSLIVMESTANGIGNFFHREWLRAIEGKSDKTPIFVPWFETDMYSEPFACSAQELWDSLSDYEHSLWDDHPLITLEQLNWYHLKSLEYGSPDQMKAEYPSTAAEAFATTNTNVFPTTHIEAQRPFICPPATCYEVAGSSFIPSPAGRLEVWAEPCPHEEESRRPGYLVTMDVGGVWEGADWSVIAVFDVRTPDRMELVAQWRGHIEIDRLGDIAAAIGRRYHNALLVVESNSLESRALGVLERLAAGGYRNLYRRVVFESPSGQQELRYGFHTNVATKGAAMADLAAQLRDGILIEHSAIALEELAAYSRSPSGKFSAPDGLHDDTVMTRAIAAYALRQCPPRTFKPFPN